MASSSSSVLDAIAKDDELDQPLNDRQKLTKEVKSMLEKTGKKIKTLKEHKEDVQRRTEDARKESSSRREAEENKERQLAERNVRKWENNYTSEENNTDEKGLTVCYCKHCGQYSMVLDAPISKLPVRSTDKSIVVNEQKRVCKRFMVPGQIKLIRRKQGIERQYRFNCKQCGLILCYRTVAHDQSGKYTYVINNALTDTTDGLLCGKAKVV